MTISEFALYLHTTTIPQCLSLTFHIFCSASLIIYLFSNRNQTPILQNSPLLTIFSQLTLILSSICLFLSKISYLSFHKYNSDIIGRGCYVAEDDAYVAGLNLVYTFSVEFLYVSYLLKMMRVLLVGFGDKWVERLRGVFGGEGRLIGVGVCWAMLVTAGDLLMKIYMHPNPGIHVYPQFNQFLCDINVHQPYRFSAVLIWNLKLAIYLILFLYTLYLSYQLQQINNTLNLRLQYFILLILPYSVMVTDKIFKIVDPDVNTAMPVHYVDCVSNLLAGFLMMWLYFGVAGADFSLPDQGDLGAENGADDIDLYYIFNDKYIAATLQLFFQHKNRPQVFKTKSKMLNPSYDHCSQQQQKATQILQCLTEEQKREVSRNRNKKFESAKDKVDQIVRNLIREWMSTVSGHAMMKRMKKNGEYFKRMRKLGLVKINQVPRLGSSSGSIMYSSR